MQRAPNYPSEITLTWEPLRGISEFTEGMSKGSSSKVRGVYFWGFEKDDIFIPYYVGKANHIYQRALEHIAGLNGGSYKIYDPDEFHEYFLRLYKNNIDSKYSASKQSLVKPDPIYIPTSVHEWQSKFHKPGTREKIDVLLQRFRFTYTQLDNGIETWWIEQALADHFCRKYLEATITSNKNVPLMTIHHKGDPKIEYLFSIPVRPAILDNTKVVAT